MKARIPRLPRAGLAEFCVRNHVRRLSLFGSSLRRGLRGGNDVDLLVEFLPGEAPGLFGLERMEAELSKLLGRRRVDLRTPGEISPRFRARVLKEAEVQFTS